MQNDIEPLGILQGLAHCLGNRQVPGKENPVFGTLWTFLNLSEDPPPFQKYAAIPKDFRNAICPNWVVKLTHSHRRETKLHSQQARFMATHDDKIKIFPTCLGAAPLADTMRIQFVLFA
ncbi:hypothetical protein E2542_SST00851 [Spatholobus suberectus]|nr:hypothetical protein E2542_SST00851 [Spatholobus suberectus]